MAAPTFTWNRTYVMGDTITGRLEAPITPVATTLITSTSGTYGTSTFGSQFQFDMSGGTGTFGGRTVFTSTRDLSAYSFIGFIMTQFQWNFPATPAGSCDTFANGGISIAFFDSSANYSEFYIFGNEFSNADATQGGWQQYTSPGSAGPLPIVLERSRTPDATSGTLDWANIDGFEFIIRTTSTDSANAAVEVTSMVLYDPPTVTAGDSGSNATFDTFKDNITAANSSYQVVTAYQDTSGNFLGNIGSLYEPHYTYEMGDGSTATYFRDTGSTLAPYPLANTTRATMPVMLLAAEDRGVEINTTATCDMVFSGTIFAAVDVDAGEDFINVAGNTSGTVTFTNCLFYRKTYVRLAHATATGPVFDDCEEVRLTADSTLTGGTMRNFSGTSVGLEYTGVAADKSAITCDFTSNSGIDLKVGNGGAGTFDFTGLTVSGGHTLNVWNPHASNSVTVELASGVSNQAIDLWFAYDNEASGPFSEGELLTFGNSATATLVVLQDNGATGTMYCELVSGSVPPDNNSISGGTSSATANVDEASGANSSTLTISVPAVTFTINTNVSALIQIYTNNTQTVLDSTTGTSLAFAHSSQTVGYTIQAAGYIPQRFTGVALSGTSSVTINLVADPIYNASHGLTFTTDYSYNANTRVMTIVANQEGRDLYSALIDDFQTETALRNCPFPITAIGPDRFDFDAVGYYNSGTTVGATIDSGDITFWKGAGMQWEHDTTGNPTKKFYSIKSSNSLVASSVVGYTQVVTGTPVEATLVSNQVNQVIQYFEDTNGDGSADYDYSGHLMFKGFLTGYYQARWDVINDGGVTTLEPYEYNISLTQEAIAGTTGDQTITIATLTDHTGAPLSVGGKSFDFELVDPGSNDADNLLAQVNYDVYNAVNTSISGTLYTSYQAFDLPDMLVEAGANTETEYGYFEGDGAVTDLSGVYLSRSSADHPGITRFQSNDGTYYTPAVTSDISITGLTDAGGSVRLQIHNDTAKTASAWAATTAYSAGDQVLRSTGVGTEQTAGLYMVCTTAGTSSGSEPTWDTTVGNTTADGTVTWTTYAILYYDDDPASTSYSDTYTDGEEFSTGDTYRIRYADLNATTSFSTYETTGIVSSTGFTVAASPSANSVYAANGIDGSSASVTNKFSPDYSNNEIDLDTNSDFQGKEAFAYYCYELTTTNGMYTVWGAVDAIDQANYRNNVSVFSIFFDETAGFVKQTDSVRWFRDDDTRPARDPTTGGNGIEVNWRSQAFAVATGSGVTAQDKTDIIDGVHDKTTENGEKFIETTRLIRSAVAGESTVSGTTYTFRDAADSKARITATVDSNGQRTSVTTDSS